MTRHPPLHSLVSPLKPESLHCLQRLADYERVVSKRRFPIRRSAAVAIVLFVGRLGDLYVLLSTRSGNISYPNDTALPGGKVDAGDIDAEGTARREAFEEIGLPLDHDKVRCLTILEPFLSGNSLIVHPVVLLVTDNTINPILNPQEVSHLFSMPLYAFLQITPSERRVAVKPPGVVGVAGLYPTYHSYRDIQWGEGKVRMHRFLTGREEEGIKPVYGLTAAILVKAASLGYAQTPAFQYLAPGQEQMDQRIEHEITVLGGALRRAVELEGLEADWGLRPATKAKL